MKIALLGYGKMGKTIEKIALERGHQIVAKISSSNTHEFTQENFAKADVVIEFSKPELAFENISTCLNWALPVISGTTGWLKRYNEIINLCTERNGSFLYGSNFSLGVNLFFELNNKLAEMMSKFSEYNVKLEEIHHTEKLDAPSGTAITLAEGIIEKNKNKTNWKCEEDENKNAEINETLSILSLRKPNVPGTHSIIYESKIDEITITHEAFSRDGFALGAVIAAEFIQVKKGIFTMRDVLDL